MSELLPCPFCGGEAQFVEEDDEIAIWCLGECHVCGGYHEPEQRERAIAAWNRRTALTLPAKPE